ncbi:hypothetical protein VSDG_08818 [Cytospora chrysosperma]|uniref:Rhodopsin domain-containing protein n=1 Tax=Cytospora chrysosperma TaxID=252740 RepID=A0A423VGK3_CYTCH|nr:hypothetical protein VSDG_08818 [Valsa sordida]
MSGSLTVRLDDNTAGGHDCGENIGPTGLAVIWVMVTVAMIVVAARVYAQARLTKQFGLSDYLMICSITIICGFASLISVQYRYGWGRHQACIGDLQEVETQLKFNVTGQSFGIMGSTFGRLSFIVFMLHLFDAKTWPRLSLRVFFVLQVVTNVGTVIACYAQCSDPRALYDFSLPESLCWPAEVQTYLGYAHTSFNGVTDLYLAALPTAILWNLQMATRLKIGLAILLGMSAVALVGLVMKCVYLSALSDRGDFSYNTVPMFTWITVEGTLVEIAASVPLLRPLFKRRFGGLKSSNKPSSYELPRYTPRSGKADSSGLSGKIGRARTTIRSSGTHGAGVGGEDDDSSMEGILPMRGSDLHKHNNNAIMVRQEYSVDYQDAAHETAEGGMDGSVRVPSEQSLRSMDQQQHQKQLSIWSGGS